jgi:hypothetical protein
MSRWGSKTEGQGGPISIRRTDLDADEVSTTSRRWRPTFERQTRSRRMLRWSGRRWRTRPVSVTEYRYAKEA